MGCLWQSPVLFSPWQSKQLFQLPNRMKGSWLHGLLFYSCLQSISNNRKGSIQHAISWNGTRAFLRGYGIQLLVQYKTLTSPFQLSFPHSEWRLAPGFVCWLAFHRTKREIAQWRRSRSFRFLVWDAPNLFNHTFLIVRRGRSPFQSTTGMGFYLELVANKTKEARMRSIEGAEEAHYTTR